MARVLEANGAKVVREYYFNDHGEQINRFAKSLVAAWAEANNLGEAGYQTETPCDGYKGAYINEIAARVQAEAESDGVDLTALAHQDQGLNDDGEPLGEADTEVREEFRKRAVPMMFDEIQKSMKDFRVNFDVWFHENSLYADGKVDAAIEELKSRGDIFDKDGATWFESTKHGDDKDRVIIKSNGEFAYFAADIAYYWDKRHRAENPADVAIYMLGADHHGYIGRMMAMCAAFGDEPGKNMQILIGQLVNVMKDGKPVRMSKRAGNATRWPAPTTTRTSTSTWPCSPRTPTTTRCTTCSTRTPAPRTWTATQPPPASATRVPTWPCSTPRPTARYLPPSPSSRACSPLRPTTASRTRWPVISKSWPPPITSGTT